MALTTPYSQRIPQALVAGLLILLAGCGSPTSKVSGTVKLKDGQPVQHADIVFVLESDANVEFQAHSDSTGKYKIDYGSKKGMPPGKYKVTVTWYRLANGQPLPEGEEGDALKGTPRVREFMDTVSKEISEGDDVSLDLEVTPKKPPV